MDIAEALRIIRENTARAQNQMDADTGHPLFCEVANGTVSAIVDAWEAIDAWLCSGGFLPPDWQR